MDESFNNNSGQLSELFVSRVFKQFSVYIYTFDGNRYCSVVLVSGLQFGAGERVVSDTGSVVQADWIDSEFLHTTGRDDTDVHADRPTLGREKAKPSDGHHARQLQAK